MATPTPAEAFERFSDGLRNAQEAAATLSHLFGLQGDRGKAEKFLLVSENMKLVANSARMVFITRSTR